MMHTGARTLAAAAALALTVTGIVTAATPAPAPVTHTTDAAGCWYDPTVPGWITDAGDGVCRTGEHSFDLTHEDTSDFVVDADGCVHSRGTSCADGGHDSRYVMANGQPGGYWLDANGQTLDCDDNDCVFVKPADPQGAMTVTYAPEQPVQATIWEDGPGFNCTTMGNHICGPGNSEGLPAGCYEDLQDAGTLVVAWTRYDDPSADPLWQQANPTGNCLAIAGTQLVPQADEVDTELALAR